MKPQQVAGHLGVANNPQCSPAAQHASRVAVINAASGSGRSSSSVAGQVGVTTNPQCSAATQHSARQSVMSAVASGRR
jgi:hypothetical protein